MNGAEKLKPIVILGTVRYNPNFFSTSFNTALYLAKYTKVFYIENPYTIRDVVKGYFKKSRKKLRPGECAGATDTMITNLTIYTPPPMLSTNFLREGSLYRVILSVNERKLAGYIKKKLRKENIREFIFINSFNFHYPKVGKLLKPLLNIYQSVDPIIVDFDKRHGFVSEDMLHQQCDLIFCTSKALYEEKKKHNPNTYFTPNAADACHFAKAMDQRTAVHPFLRTLRRPVIGYVGTVERRFDYSLLKAVFEQNTDKDFVFVGPIIHQYVPAWFFEIPHVKFIGSTNYQELPSIIKGFDVCLIPFKVDEVSRTIFPLKLFEYLGTGKPVVSTSFNADLVEFTGDTVKYCHTAQDVTEALEACLQDPTKGLAERVEVANKNTWHARAQQMVDIMIHALEKKAHRHEPNTDLPKSGQLR